MPWLCGTGRRCRSETDRPAGMGGVRRAAADAASADAAIHGESADRSTGGGHLFLRSHVPEAAGSRNHPAAAELMQTVQNHPPAMEGGFLLGRRKCAPTEHYGCVRMT